MRAAAGTASSSARALEDLSTDGLARLADQQIVAAEQLRHAHAGIRIVVVEAAVHARLVVGAREHLAERLHHGFLDRRRAGVLAPCRARELRGAGLIALREQGAGERELALRGDRLLRLEERQDSRGTAALVPQRALGAPPHHGGVRPARILRAERGEAVEARVVLVAAQDGPLDQLAGERIADRLLDGGGFAGLAAPGEIDRLLRQRDVGGGRRGALGGSERSGRHHRSACRRRGVGAAQQVGVAAAAGVNGEKLIVGRIAAGESAARTDGLGAEASVNCGRGRGRGVADLRRCRLRRGL